MLNVSYIDLFFGGARAAGWAGLFGWMEVAGWIRVPGCIYEAEARIPSGDYLLYSRR
jgi:hypothetical protein